jgi:IS5 family transposase
LSPRFKTIYSPLGRPSIPPEMLLRALLLQVLYTVRSERLLMEQLDDNLLFRWFVGLNMDEPVWDEEIFGWLKTVGLMRKTRHHGVLRVGWMFTFAAAVYNLVRIRNLTAVTT